VVETPQVDGPYGARGVGEHPMIAVCAALGNAIQDACGADWLHMPIRQEDRRARAQGQEPHARAQGAGCSASALSMRPA
jgi:CO/xanthine dehydrogenase Mo-binding subunit